LMTPVLGAKVCSNLIDRVLVLEDVKDIRELRPLLRAPDHSELFRRPRSAFGEFAV